VLSFLLVEMGFHELFTWVGLEPLSSLQEKSIRTGKKALPIINQDQVTFIPG
jgi:hypothetical protein